MAIRKRPPKRRMQPRLAAPLKTERPGANAGYGSQLTESSTGSNRCDTDGNLWCGWGMGEGLDGVVVFNPEGKRIGAISLPERSANLCFGGVTRNRLFMAASHSLYSLYVGAQGAIGG